MLFRSFFVLGTPQDSNGDGLTDAYERLVMKGSLNLGDLVDWDGDGIPDAWYVQHGLNPLAEGIADADSNGDGIPNKQEYWLGRDPCADTAFEVWVATPKANSIIP